jgi:hypothetical protein
MVNPVLVDYLKKGVKRGFSVGQLRKELLKQGWNRFEVNRAIQIVSKDSTLKVKSNKSGFVFYFLGALFLVVLLIVGIFLFSSSSGKVSEGRLIKGTSLDMKTQKVLSLDLGEEKHSVFLKSVKGDSVSLLFDGSKRVDFDTGDEKRLDLDNDGYYDLKMKISDVSSEKVSFYLIKIDEKVCNPKWDCGDWGECQDEIQIRDCIDLNDCGVNDRKPNEEQDCEEEANVSYSLNFEVGDENYSNDSNLTTSEDESEYGQGFGEPVFIFDSIGDFDSFNSSLEDCSPASITFNVTFDLFGIGIFQENLVYYELQGLEEDRCVVYSRAESYRTFYSSEYVQSLLDEGVTQEEIDLEVEELNVLLLELVGNEGTCKYPLSDLVEIFRGMSEGVLSFSSEDVEKYGCSGNLYSPEL